MRNQDQFPCWGRRGRLLPPTPDISISKFAQGLEGGHTTFHTTFLSVPPGPWPGQNTAIYRTGATWASKWPLGPARVLLECPAGPFGPVSALPGRSKCRSVTHQNSAIYRTAATWPSKLPLRPAQVLVECPAGRLGLFWRCQGAQNGCSEPPVCLKRRFRQHKHCYM